MPRQRFLWLFRAACIDGENSLKEKTARVKKNIISKKTFGHKKREVRHSKIESNWVVIKEIISDNSKDRVFRFDFFGQMTNSDLTDISCFTKGLDNFYETISDDADLKVSIISQDESDNLSETQKNEIQKLSIRVMKPGECIILSKEHISVMLFAFEYPSVSTIDDGVLSQIDIDLINIAKERKVDYLIAYGIGQERVTKECLEATAQYEKALIEGGCNYIFSSFKDEICQERSADNINEHTFTKVVSTGNIFGVKANDGWNSNGIRGGAIIKTSLHFLQNSKGVVESTEYVPYYVRKTVDTETHMELIDYRNSIHMQDEEIRRILGHIDSKMGGIKYIGSAFTVKQICELLGESLPPVYSYLSDVPVGKVCTRASEVSKGDLLFVLEQYKFTNDDDVRPWILRKRIASVSINRGAVFVISHRPLPASIPHIVVNNSREAHIKVCREIRNKYRIKIVGVTGSVGKTSTKDILFDVLKQKYNTRKSVRNANAQVNIGMHLQEIKGTHEFLVQEIDGSRPGSASRHSRMLQPEVGVITNIGWAHIGNFGTQEKLLEAKLGIVDGISDGGTLVVNWDDPLLSKIDKETLGKSLNLKNIEKVILKKIENIQVVSYAIDNKKADYYADEIDENEDQTDFYIVHGDERVRAHLNVIGKYNVLNAVCSYAIGKMYNIADEDIVKGLSDFTTSGVRQNQISVGGYKLFVDCFNSSPTSVESSLSVLDAMECKGKKIAIIGDITGADNLAESVHKSVGDIINRHSPDVVICYGKYSKIIFEKIKDRFESSYYFQEKNSLNEFIKSQMDVGDVILFKGSSKMMLYERIDECFGTMLSDQVYMDDNKFRTITRGGIHYNIYRTYGTAIKGHKEKCIPRVAKSILGLPIYNIGVKAFWGRTDIEEIVIDEGIRHIGKSCFEGSGIKELDFPNTVKFLDAKAFKECVNLKRVNMRQGIIHIGDSAFEGCTNLEMVTLPGSITEMGRDVFKGCERIKVCCLSGSYGERYCIANQIDFVSI